MQTKKTPRAVRPVFIPGPSSERVHAVDVEFEWFPGFAMEQQRRSVAALHDAIKRRGLASAPLEISTRSTEDLGRRLSAFNLKVKHPSLGIIPLESAFQSSKVFRNGGPYLDLATKDPKTAKRDARIQHNTTPLISFRFGEEDFPIMPTTVFYDWLYIQALSLVEPGILRHLCERDGFTDIAFNPARSLNCQARSAALFVSLVNEGRTELWHMAFDDFVELSVYTHKTTKGIMQSRFR